jgi:hypothetical protein
MRYVIGILVAIGLVVLVFILILKGFSGGTTKSTTKPLVDYATTNTSIQMLIDGPVNADQVHYQVQMTVSDTQNQLNVLKGYQGTVVNSQTYESNSASYAEFLRALDIAGFAKGDTSKTADNDPRGFCALGERYTFEIMNGSKTIENFWSSSCGGVGTFEGNTIAVKNLFIAQMPNYGTVTNNLDVY